MNPIHVEENTAAQASIVNNAPVLKLRKKGHAKSPLLKGANAKAPIASSSDPLPLGALQTARLDEIVVENRARKELGDLKGLARSMAEEGLAQPPLVDAQMRLVCGYRRYMAAQSLGWEEMPVRALDIEDPLALMVAEDACRKDLTSSEKYAICETLRARAQEDRWRKRAFGGRLETAKEKGRLDEEIGKALRLSRESLRKIRAVHLAAEEDPTHFADLVAMLDVDGRVDRHYRELERRRSRGDATRAAAIVVAPGWESLFEEAEPKEVAKFVKASLLAAGAEEGTALLLPSTLAALAHAVDLLRQGGFDWKATLRGSGAPGQELWLLAANGRKVDIPFEAVELLAEGCAQSVDAAMESAGIVAEGDVRNLDLGMGMGA